MTTPTGGSTNPGQTDNAATPSVGGTELYSASGAAGGAEIEAPDNQYGSVHRPGQTPGVAVASGPAVMKIGAKKSNKGNKKK